MYFIKTTQGFLLPDSTRCLSGLQRRAGQRLLVCYGWRGGGHPPVLLSSAQPLLSSPVLSLSLVWISCLVRSRNSPAKVGTHQGRCHNSKVFVFSEWGHIDTTFVRYTVALHCQEHKLMVDKSLHHYQNTVGTQKFTIFLFDAVILYALGDIDWVILCYESWNSLFTSTSKCNLHFISFECDANAMKQ